MGRELSENIRLKLLMNGRIDRGERLEDGLDRDRCLGGETDIRYEVFPDLGGANAIYPMPIISSSKVGAW